MEFNKYNFTSNDFSEKRQKEHILFNSDGQHQPNNVIGSKYPKTNSFHYQMEEIAPYLKNKRHAIDIGSRWGSCACECQNLGFEYVHLIEIQQKYFKGISYNVDFSKADGYNYAAGDKVGHWNPKTHKTQDKEASGSIPSISGDSLNVEHCDFIKIDTDGPDRLALDGCWETIQRCKPIIYIELDEGQRAWESKHGLASELDKVWWKVCDLYTVIRSKVEKDNYIMVPKND